MKALVGAFNQEKALVGALTVIVKSSRTFVSSSSFEEVRPDVWGQDRDGARQILLHELPQSGAASINSGYLMVLILLSTLLQSDC